MALAGLIRPTVGTVAFQGNPVDRPSRERGVVFQDLALLPWRTVEANIGHGLAIAKVPKAQRRERVASLVQAMGLHGFERHYLHQLSGGMRQRVAIARTWAPDPPAILMDEPFGAVDAQTRLSLQQQLLDFTRGSRKTLVFITHSVEEALFLGTDVAIMTRRPGRIKELIHIDRDGLPPDYREFMHDQTIVDLHEHVLGQVRSEVDQ
jgi:NitT/TauT family transport system ATP-binding protein